jgi:hypothetical protein
MHWTPREFYVRREAETALYRVIDPTTRKPARNAAGAYLDEGVKRRKSQAQRLAGFVRGPAILLDPTKVFA